MSNYKISTDNIPLLDDIVHYLKRLCTESVIKVQKEADKNETEAMSIAAYRYLCAVDDSAPFNLYSYRKNDMIDAGVPLEIIHKAFVDLSYVPKSAQTILLRNKKEEIIQYYEERNIYYRTLNGLPATLDDYIFLEDYPLPQEVQIYNLELPLHSYSDVELDLLYHYGVIDDLKQRYPDFKYLNYLGSRRIPIYTARKASNLSLLYHPSDIPPELIERFKDKLVINRHYIETVVYSHAYQFKSEYYENFLAVLLMILTMTDIITEMPDMINKNEIFDLKMIKLIFNNYDIDYFDEIPFHYQLAMVKNLHKLIKFKSTTLNIIDICSIFGFDSIKVFKYYLLKERKMAYGKYVSEYDENWELDNKKSFDLKFIKVPITETVTKYLNNDNWHIDYDEITNSDKLWDGGLDHEHVKEEILKLEFNHYYTKYLSVDVLNSVTKLSFQMAYFYNILFDDHNVEDRLTVDIGTVYTNKKLKLLDVLCFLYALGYKYRGYEDTIFSKTTKVLYVMGFNFEADLDTLASRVKEKGYTFEDLGISGWSNPSEILTTNQLIEVYTNNKKIHDHLLYEMDHAENKRVYDVYKMVFDALMITKYNGKIFTMPNGKIATTYTEFIKSREPVLFKMLLDIDKISNIDDKRTLISKYINDITLYLSEYIRSDELDHVFAIYPTVSRDAIRNYIRTVIEFFKHYTIDIENVNTILRFDDKFQSKVRLLDDLFMKKLLRFKDFVDLIDKIKMLVSFDIRDKIEPTDFAHILAIIIRELFFKENITIDDDISRIDINFQLSDKIIYDTYLAWKSYFKVSSKFDVYDYITWLISYSFKEKIKIEDNCTILKINIKDLYFSEENFMKDIFKYNSSYNFEDMITFEEAIRITNL